MPWDLDATQLVTPVLTAVLGFLAGNWTRFRLAGRLRASVAADLAILKELPDGPAREVLARQVEYRAHLIATEEEPYTTQERYDRRWAFTWLGMGVLVPSMLRTSLDLGTSAAGRAVGAVTVLAGAVMILYGLHVLIAAKRKREHRKVKGRVAADVDRDRS